MGKRNRHGREFFPELVSDVGTAVRLEHPVTEYLIIPEHDRQGKDGLLVQRCRWTDLRETAPSRLPPPVSGVYRVYELDRAGNQALYGAARFLGALYAAADAGLVLTQYVPPALRDLFAFIGGCAAAPAPAPPPCPTVHALTGSSTYPVGFYTTRGAAAAAARSGVKGYATTLAGLERNAFTCPNPACTVKTLGPVTYIITDIDTEVNIKYSLLNTQIMYEGTAEFTWFATLTCV